MSKKKTSTKKVNWYQLFGFYFTLGGRVGDVVGRLSFGRERQFSTLTSPLRYNYYTTHKKGCTPAAVIVNFSYFQAGGPNLQLHKFHPDNG